MNVPRNQKEHQNSRWITTITEQKTWYRHREEKAKSLIPASGTMLGSTCNIPLES